MISDDVNLSIHRPYSMNISSSMASILSTNATYIFSAQWKFGLNAEREHVIP